MDHYKNEHANCPKSSRCQRDPNYEPSRKVITNPKAEKLLTTTILSSLIYKAAGDFMFGKETFFVESYNNTMNIFQDKRIVFSDEEYQLRSMLATLHWNDNVDRESTSTWSRPTTSRTKRRKTKKNYKGLSYDYRQKIWNNYMDLMTFI